MSRIRKKIEKRAAQLLIKSNIFNQSDYCDIEKCFYSMDYFGEYTEINPWEYLYSLVVDLSTEYPKDSDELGRCFPIKRNEYPSIIEAIKIFKSKVLFNQ